MRGVVGGNILVNPMYGRQLLFLRNMENVDIRQEDIGNLGDFPIFVTIQP